MVKLRKKPTKKPTNQIKLPSNNKRNYNTKCKSVWVGGGAQTENAEELTVKQKPTKKG